ncbi:MAG: efflux RND transporter periplasmic adaptor subunit [Sulfuricurvum sp.]|nr:efflux RND transporter periplasmic adaptor subunit [Sulfuricurvum sp.]
MRTTFFALSCITALLILSGCEKEEKAHVDLIKSVQTPIETLTPSYGNFNSIVTANASVEPSPDGIVSISTPISGTVAAIKTSIGENVTPSDTLLSIRSSDVSDVQTDKIAAKAAYTQAKRVYGMNKELLALGAITTNDFAISESNLHQAEAMMNGYSEKLNYMGATSGQTIALRSPIPGVVYEIGTHLGEKVANDSDHILIKVANSHRKIIVATVYEKDLSAFEKGKQVQILVRGHVDTPIEGTITYVSDVLDAENKTTKVYIKPNSDSPLLKINMFTVIHLNAENKNVFRIPKKSLLFKEGKFIVYVKQGENFIPKEVTLVNDDASDDYSLIKGITPNVQIASEAIVLEKE